MLLIFAVFFFMLVEQLRKKALKNSGLTGIRTLTSAIQCSTILFPVRQLLTANFERVAIVCALAGVADKNTKRLFSVFSHCMRSEFHVKFHLNNPYRTHHFAVRAISVFRVKFNVVIHLSGSECCYRVRPLFKVTLSTCQE